MYVCMCVSTYWGHLRTAWSHLEAPKKSQDCPKRLQKGPARPQEGLKGGPGRAKRARGGAQDGPKTTQSRFQVAFNNDILLPYLQTPSGGLLRPPPRPLLDPSPKLSLGHHRKAQEAPKKAPRGLKMTPEREKERDKRKQREN